MFNLITRLGLGFFGWLLFLAGSFIPKSNRIWIFGAWFGNRYSDNSRYLHEYVLNEQPTVRAIWLTHRQDLIDFLRIRGFEAYRINSLKGYWYGCRSKIVIISNSNTDVNQYIFARTKLVQLWHATPLKKIKNDDLISENPRHNPARYRIKRLFMALFPYYYRKWDLAIASSPVIATRFASAFNMALDRISITGYPRCDSILKANNSNCCLNNNVITKSEQTTILFAPTFRRDPNLVKRLFDDFGDRSFNRFLKHNNCRLFINMHYMNQALIPSDITSEYIHCLDSSIDINGILNQFDILITDYSGIYFDYLLLDRPIIFTPFDLKEYLVSERELYEDYDQATPGPKCRNWDEVVPELAKLLNGIDGYIKQRKSANLKYNTFVDEQNSKRVYDSIVESLIK